MPLTTALNLPTIPLLGRLALRNVIPELADHLHLGAFCWNRDRVLTPLNVRARGQMHSDRSLADTLNSHARERSVGGTGRTLVRESAPDTRGLLLGEGWSTLTSGRQCYRVQLVVPTDDPARARARAGMHLRGANSDPVRWMLVMHCGSMSDAVECKLDDTSGVELLEFTAREREVWHCIGAGRSNNEIAESLHISIHTARRHTERLFRKLRVTTRAAAAREYYLRHRGVSR